MQEIVNKNNLKDVEKIQETIEVEETVVGGQENEDNDEMNEKEARDDRSAVLEQTKGRDEGDKPLPQKRPGVIITRTEGSRAKYGKLSDPELWVNSITIP